MAKRQLPLEFSSSKNVSVTSAPTTREKLLSLLGQDLDFHDQQSNYASHNFHAFPAKFPPQLPRRFIEALTAPGEAVLDPMMGSGTTVVEAFLTGRHGIGTDIDPLALLIAQVKVTPLPYQQVYAAGQDIVIQASRLIRDKTSELQTFLEQNWDVKTREFITYWFAPITQMELAALWLAINQVSDPELRAFFLVALSAIIITKSGGVSLALDLAHTRPHRAKLVLDKQGQAVLLPGLPLATLPRARLLTKTLRSAISEFDARFRQNLKSLPEVCPRRLPPLFCAAKAQRLPFAPETIDLIVTSPPYASNAIDYMRAHKFSLVWLGYSIDQLSSRRKEYIGSEDTVSVPFEPLPDHTTKVVATVSDRDYKRGRVLHRYYSEMTASLREMYRVLKPDKAAIVVVGNSTLRGVDTEVPRCLAEIGQSLGFEVPAIGTRRLDRNRRMMPAGTEINCNSQIQQRMHEEYVIGFYKPAIVK